MVFICKPKSLHINVFTALLNTFIYSINISLLGPKYLIQIDKSQYFVNFSPRGKRKPNAACLGYTMNIICQIQRKFRKNKRVYKLLLQAKCTKVVQNRSERLIYVDSEHSFVT